MMSNIQFKSNTVKFLLGLFALVASFIMMPVERAYATTTACYYDTSSALLPSVSGPTDSAIKYSYTSSTTCLLTLTNDNTPVGTLKVDTSQYWTGDAYVANDIPDSCSVTASSGTYSGSYKNGVCTFADAVVPGATPVNNSAGTLAYKTVTNIPTGGQPMCSSGALATGGAVFGFVFTGAICQANAITPGSDQIYAYATDTNGSTNTDGVNAKAFWARDTITSNGLMTSLGGAQLVSLNGDGSVNSALIIDDKIAKIGSAEPTNGRTATLILDSNLSSAPSASLYGSVGTGTELNPSASNKAVSISGDGRGGRAYTVGSTPTWADVLISSKNFNGTLGNNYTNSVGSAIVVTDYGIQIITPAPGTDQKILNNFGANNQVDPLNPTNGTTTNNFGGGSGITVNNFGNTNPNSSNVMSAANTNISMQSGTIASTIGLTRPNDPTSGNGDSVLTNPSGGTSSATTSVLRGTDALRTVVDSNGKLTLVNVKPADPLDQTTSAMTVTNGYGNIHGFMVNETQASMSGGVNSTTMTLNDYGATFSNSANGAPVQVHGVFDGTAEFDAVNVRQLYGAVAASMATVPTFNLEPGETGIGIGTGVMGTYPAVGVSFATKNKNGSQFNVGVAAAEHVPVAVRAGLGWVW